MTILAFLKSLTPLGRIIAAVVPLLILAALYIGLRSYFIGDANVRADLGNEQAGAAIESGADAVGTVGNNQDAADETRSSVEEIQNEVDEATDADSADRAGRDGLCLQFGIC